MDGLIALVVILGIVSSIYESATKQKKKKTGTADTRTKEKPKGFFAALEEELKKAEAEERRQREEQLAMSQPKKKKKSAAPKPVAPQEPRVITYDAYGEDDLLGEQYRAEQQRKFESSFDKGPVAARAADANYQIQEKSGFRIESLQERYPNPAQQMIVLAEILGKPVSMRR